MSPETYARAERAFYSVAQTSLREFETDEPDLYPDTEGSA